MTCDICDDEASRGLFEIKLTMVAPKLGFADLVFAHVTLCSLKLTGDRGDGNPLIIAPRRTDRSGVSHRLWTLSPELWELVLRELHTLWGEVQNNSSVTFPRKLVWRAP